MAEKPEECARAEIDRLLAVAGWAMQPFAEAKIHASRGIAISRLWRQLVEYFGAYGAPRVGDVNCARVQHG